MFMLAFMLDGCLIPLTDHHFQSTIDSSIHQLVVLVPNFTMDHFGLLHSLNIPNIEADKTYNESIHQPQIIPTDSLSDSVKEALAVDILLKNQILSTLPHIKGNISH